MQWQKAELGDKIRITMAKQKKKRNKHYTGQDAKTNTPQVIRVEAVQRSRVGQWWHEKKRFAKPVAIAAAVVFIVVFLITELVRLVT